MEQKVLACMPAGYTQSRETLAGTPQRLSQLISTGVPKVMETKDNYK